MKPFNLEQAKAGKPVCTRDGHKVRIVCFDVKDDVYPILALIDKIDYEKDYSYTADGKWDLDGEENELDLMMESTHHEGYINIYSDNTTGINIYETEGKAKSMGGDNYLTTIKIEWED